jgi:hypothetical protein
MTVFYIPQFQKSSGIVTFSGIFSERERSHISLPEFLSASFSCPAGKIFEKLLTREISFVTLYYINNTQ